MSSLHSNDNSLENTKLDENQNLDDESSVSDNDYMDSDEDDNNNNDFSLPMCTDCAPSPLQIMTKEASNLRKITLKTKADMTFESEANEFLDADNIRKVITTKCCAGKCLRNLCPLYDKGCDLEAFNLVWHCRNDALKTVDDGGYERHIRQLLSGKITFFFKKMVFTFVPA